MGTMRLKIKFKLILTGLNSEFFLSTGYHTNFEEPSLSFYSSVLFPRLSTLCYDVTAIEMDT